ncbi:MAG: SH3 domain-containing protein [Defluviitaleaceae bacterium]|nr:SH3 domain-containing protein [Defluviitaleaceae bacterium]
MAIRNLTKKVKVLQEHHGEGQFPTFPKGTAVTLTGEECTHFLHWYPCEIDGHATYVPDTFIDSGVLTRDYNPTELVQNAGDMLTVNEIVNAWLIATNDAGQKGWIPAEICITH